MHRLMIFLLASIALSSSTFASATQILYWTDGNSKILRSNLDGSDLQDVVTGLTLPNGIAYHSGENKIYWTNGSGPASGTVQRANLDGSNIETIVSGLEFPWGISINIGSGQIYWADTGSNKIQRANLDGTGLEDLLSFGVGSGATSVALDTTSGHMYLGLRTGGATSPIMRANLDGSDLQNLLPSFDENPTQSARGLALDLTAGAMYWTSAGVWQAGLDGNEPQLLYSDPHSHAGIAINSIDSKLYFTNESNGSILRSNFDGSGVEIIAALQGDPRGITIVPEPSTALLLLGGLLGLSLRQGRCN